MNAERLLKLADHLENGKLGHDRFDFGIYNYQENCGSSGCALGECPTLFPEDWMFVSGVYPQLISLTRRKASPRRDAKIYFDISEGAAGHLFYPDEQNTKKYGGADLEFFATKEQVASNIREFVKRMA